MTETMEPPQGVVKLRELKRMLPVRLTFEEQFALGRRLAAIEDELHEEAERQKLEVANMKARTALLVAERHQVASTHRRGVEEREVLVQVIADHAAGLAREVRVDTQEILLTRQLEESERQRHLFDVVPGGQPGEPAADGAAPPAAAPDPHAGSEPETEEQRTARLAADEHRLEPAGAHAEDGAPVDPTHGLSAEELEERMRDNLEVGRPSDENGQPTT